jgi:hypothetical protein
LEIREIIAKDGRGIQTPEAARKALQQDISSGETAIRKKLLTALTGLGLVDVATDYGPLLLAFTKSGLSGMELTPGPSSWIGTDEAIAYEWRQTTGGVLEFRGRTVNRRAMRGREAPNPRGRAHNRRSPAGAGRTHTGAGLGSTRTEAGRGTTKTSTPFKEEEHVPDCRTPASRS